MSLSPDSSHLACQTDRGRITVWSGAGGDDPSEVKEVRSLYGHQGDDFFIGRVAWDKTSTRWDWTRSEGTTLHCIAQ